MRTLRAGLRLEPGVVPNRLQALVHGKGIVKLDPLAGVPLEGKGELAVTGVLHAGELRLEGGRDGVRAGAAVG